MNDTIDYEHERVLLEEKRLAAELTSVTLSKNPDWDPGAEWVDQADYAGKLFARILRYVREELAEDGDEEDLEDEDEDDAEDADDADDADDEEDEDDEAHAGHEHAHPGRRR